MLHRMKYVLWFVGWLGCFQPGVQAQNLPELANLAGLWKESVVTWNKEDSVRLAFVGNQLSIQQGNEATVKVLQILKTYPYDQSRFYAIAQSENSAGLMALFFYQPYPDRLIMSHFYPDTALAQAELEKLLEQHCEQFKGLAWLNGWTSSHYWKATLHDEINQTYGKAKELFSEEKRLNRFCGELLDDWAKSPIARDTIDRQAFALVKVDVEDYNKYLKILALERYCIAQAMNPTDVLNFLLAALQANHSLGNSKPMAKLYAHLYGLAPEPIGKKPSQKTEK